MWDSLGRFVPDSSTSQIRSDRDDAHALYGSPEQGAEVPVIAGQEMAAIRMDGSSQDRLVLHRESDAFRQYDGRRRFVRDLNLSEQSVQPCPPVGGVDVPFCLVDRIGRTHQRDIRQAPQRQCGRHVSPPCGGKQDVGVEERSVAGQRERGEACGTASGSRPSALTSRRATSYSASVVALFRRNSALRRTV